MVQQFVEARDPGKIVIDHKQSIPDIDTGQDIY